MAPIRGVCIICLSEIIFTFAKIQGSATSGNVFSGEPTRKFDINYQITTQSSRHVQHFGSTTCVSPQWAVVTTIFKPSAAIQKVASIPGWCVVIVADKKTPVHLYDTLRNNKQIVYLSVEKQHQFANMPGNIGDFVRSLPWNHFARKNVGFLFAIRHGAKVLYDFDDDNALTVNTILPYDNTYDQIVVMKVPTFSLHNRASQKPKDLPVFNPYPLMGASTNTSWPRGFPMYQIKNTAVGWGVTLPKLVLPLTNVSLRNIGIIQILADHDPDVDAIFRLTQNIPFYFRAMSVQPSILLSPGVYTPTNAQATLHMYNALWGLFLPVTVHGRVSDIWRGYISQCIFKSINLSVVVSAPRVIQERNPHNYLADMAAEEDLYFKTDKMIEFLAYQWTDNATTVQAKLMNLAIALYEREYIEIDDVILYHKWIHVLENVGYTFPEFTTSTRTPDTLSYIQTSHAFVKHDLQEKITDMTVSATMYNTTLKDIPPRLSIPPNNARLITIIAHGKSPGFFPYALTAHACMDTCVVTPDKGASSYADAFLIYARDFQLPPKRYENKPWIIFTRENPVFTPLMNNAKMMSRFSYSSSARLDSDFPHPSWRTPEDYGLGPSLLPPIMFTKRASSPIYVANSHCEPIRTKYQAELMKYIKVDSYGSCLPNMRTSTHKIPKIYASKFQERAFAQQRRYKFTLVFMNADCDNWIDTRLLYALNAGSVPIFMGTDKVDEWLPGMTSSIIKVSDFATPKLLADYIHMVSTNETLYNTYLDWKIHGYNYSGSKMERVVDNMHHWLCNLCDTIRLNPIPRLGRIQKGMESFETKQCLPRKESDWFSRNPSHNK